MKTYNLTDTRISKTITNLNKAFKSLLDSNEYKDITVRLLTKKAGLSFRTFYRYYENIDEFAIKYLISEFSNVNNNLKQGLDRETLLSNGDYLFTVIDNNPNLYKLLSNGHLLESIKTKLKEWTINGSKHIVKKYTSNLHILDLVSGHIVNSVLYLIKWKIENNEVLTKKQMSSLYTDLIINSTLSFLENISIEI